VEIFLASPRASRIVAPRHSLTVPFSFVSIQPLGILTMNFADLGLSAPLCTAVADKGYDTPSPIQREAIPPILAGRDLMAAAQTGTGKTAAFTLPLLQRLSGGQPARDRNVRALVLTPTRELAAQVYQSAEDYGTHLPLRSRSCSGA
jgi:ATP-dependent RNA helicase RhlE